MMKQKNTIMIIDTLVFDESQITCPTNGCNPKWGGKCHSLTREAGRTVAIIRYAENYDSTGRSGGAVHQMELQRTFSDIESADGRASSCGGIEK